MGEHDRYMAVWIESGVFEAMTSYACRSARYLERGLPVFSPLYLAGSLASHYVALCGTLSTHTCVCLHWLVIKLAKVIKISHHTRPNIARKCCWFRRKTHKKLDLSIELYDRITRNPLQVCVSVLPMVKVETL